MSYLAELMLRLAAGAGELPEPVRRRHGDFAAAAQGDDGGFVGRRGRSDPYYTSFGLRTLAVLGRLDADVAEPAAAFLETQLDKRLSPVDFLALVGSAALVEMVTGQDVFTRKDPDPKQLLLERIAPLKRDDCGYAKTPKSGRSSTYQTFLINGARETLGLPIEPADKIVEMVLARQRDDGGFVELPAVRHSGTNPTAAAVGLLRMTNRFDETTGRRTAAFLESMQAADGGFRANTRIPVADLLSTFTALGSLAELGATVRIDRDAAAAFVASMQSPDGGFLGGAWDDAPDVEYTFYGIGSMALLAGAG